MPSTSVAFFFGNLDKTLRTSLSVTGEKEKPEEEDTRRRRISQDEHHSTEDLLLPDVTQSSIGEEPVNTNLPQVDAGRQSLTRRDRVKWPPADDKQWEAFDDDLDKILEGTLIEDVDKKIAALSKIAYTVGKEWFGTAKADNKSNEQTTSSRRQREIETLRKEKSEASQGSIRRQTMKNSLDSLRLLNCSLLVLYPALLCLYWYLPPLQTILKGNDAISSAKSQDEARTLSLITNHELLLNSVPKSYNNGFIVYACSKDHSCGGWSDRLSGILSVFVISLITKQQFLIHHNNPCLLADFLAPKEYDWRYNSSNFVKTDKKNYVLLNRKSLRAKKYLSGEKNLTKYFKSHINLIHMNWDFTDVIRSRPHIGSEVPWITKLHFADIYKELYNYLFKPSETLSRALKSQIRYRPKTACAHIRIGKSPTIPNDPPRHQQPLEILWNFLDILDKNVYDIFIATDDDRVVKRATNRYPKNIVNTDGKIGHIDAILQRKNLDQQDIFLKMMMDFYALINCDILILTESGFGIMAAYIRNSDSGLYCWRGSELNPCSRYTIHHMFPWPVLAPPEYFPVERRVSQKIRKKGKSV
ncbi:uncharacterized protein LOC132549579 [Ylistrum balloti]|uniref:uncharacterized protein LOC132549579 n=1 Tax=Ylistrum balloti TaxID=509963 RepID=UPI002905B498|nr:uncharacterized protein LOC132549579 [Ylistrum balloti]